MTSLVRLLLAVALSVVVSGCPGTMEIGARDAGRGDGGVLRDGSADDGGGEVDADLPDADLPDADVGEDAASPDAGPSECPAPPVCDATPPDPGPERDWNHFTSSIVAGGGSAQHRGRDLFLRESDAQWALAKFAYGVTDSDIHDEEVDIWLLRDCSTWEMLGTGVTTNDGDHATVEGVADTGGWVYFAIPDAARLGVGRHRLHFVVAGDHTTADQIIEVVPDDARFVVSDMDGTLTTSETEEFTTLLTGTHPDANPYAAELLWAYARRGYHIWYLTARPEWLGRRSVEWIPLRGFPPGVVHTTLTFAGATGASAETFKTDELNAHLARFPASIDEAFGNTATDMAAFGNVGIPPEHVHSYMFDPGPEGTRVDDYSTLIPSAEALPLVCL